MAWEHVSLTFRTEDLESGKTRPWKSASQDQMEAVRDLQRADFECVATTTLGDGSLFLTFRRPARPTPVEIEDRFDLSVGLYL